jgi:hypothetical protein
LRKSICDFRSGWVLRSQSLAPIQLDFNPSGEANGAVFQIKIIPRSTSCVSPCCDRVELECHGTRVPLPPLAAMRLGNAVRMHAARYALEVAKREIPDK